MFSLPEMNLILNEIGKYQHKNNERINVSMFFAGCFEVVRPQNNVFKQFKQLL
jgi:hypothetical protein